MKKIIFPLIVAIVFIVLGISGCISNDDGGNDAGDSPSGKDLDFWAKKFVGTWEAHVPEVGYYYQPTTGQIHLQTWHFSLGGDIAPLMDGTGYVDYSKDFDPPWVFSEQLPYKSNFEWKLEREGENVVSIYLLEIESFDRDGNKVNFYTGWGDPFWSGYTLVSTFSDNYQTVTLKGYYAPTFYEIVFYKQ